MTCQSIHYTSNMIWIQQKNELKGDLFKQPKRAAQEWFVGVSVQLVIVLVPVGCTWQGNLLSNERPTESRDLWATMRKTHPGWSTSEIYMMYCCALPFKMFHRPWHPSATNCKVDARQEKHSHCQIPVKTHYWSCIYNYGTYTFSRQRCWISLNLAQTAVVLFSAQGVILLVLHQTCQAPGMPASVVIVLQLLQCYSIYQRQAAVRYSGQASNYCMVLLEWSSRESLLGVSVVYAMAVKLSWMGVCISVKGLFSDVMAIIQLPEQATVFQRFVMYCFSAPSNTPL